ncbi:hypothetical protein [Hymenobacter persicinus]|uniref:DUF4890 domain-containing protein n=1 Tax=Hymenobacter persicinus TaxID=2025506 RepID=A0A4Q5LFS4_9BACT|nr:hypothetical protein [Hymenobacter persicinus]RYU82201.1 hypothetical protein EWM57_05315 [Hymenobacter persicinus]
MKKLLLPLFAAFLFTAATASAQTATPAPPAGRMDHHNNMTPEQRAAKQSQRLTQELGLSAEQTGRVQQIMLARDQEMQTMRGQGKPAPGPREQMGEQMKANRAKYDAQFKEVLTADQYAKYTQLEAKHHRGGMHPGDAGKLKAKNGKVKVKKTNG